MQIPETGLSKAQTTARALNHLSARLKSVMESRMRLVAAPGQDQRRPLTRMRLPAEFVDDEEERGKWLADWPDATPLPTTPSPWTRIRWRRNCAPSAMRWLRGRWRR